VAFKRYLQMIDTPGYVFDRDNVLDNPFFLSADLLVAGGAMMHKQATFFAFFIEGGGVIAEFSTFRFPR
jgi:hypothetical protein